MVLTFYIQLLIEWIDDNFDLFQHRFPVVAVGAFMVVKFYIRLIIEWVI